MNENESIQGGSTRPPWIAFSIVATVAIVIVAAFFIAQRREIAEREQRRADRLADVQRGISCASLEGADDALDSSDDGALSASIKAARRNALRALDTTGIAFGKAERLALFIANDLQEAQSAKVEGRINDRLNAALEWCEEFQSS